MPDWFGTAGSVAGIVLLTWMLVAAFGHCGLFEVTLDGCAWLWRRLARRKG